MKLSQAKDYLPLIQAAAEGKIIQRTTLTGEWKDCGDGDCFYYEFDTSEDVELYRIKPEPKLRPWNPEEVPVGALIRPKMSRDCQSLILSKTASGGIVFFPMLETTHTALDFKFYSNDALDSFEHSTDGGKTWLPCGVMEE